MSSWSIKLKFLQVLLLWAASAGLMIAVFMFGLFAGRQQGIQYALAGQDDSSLRLPLSIEQSEVNSEINSRSSELSKAEVPSPEKAAAAPDGRAGLKKEVAKKPIVVAKAEAVQAAKVPKKLAKAEPVKPPKKTAKVTKKDPIQNSFTKKVKPGWYVQVLAANTEREAAGILDKLGEKGFDASVQVASVKKIKYYRVLVGPYSNKSKANKQQTTISRLKVVPSTPFVKRVK